MQKNYEEEENNTYVSYSVLDEAMIEWIFLEQMGIESEIYED